MYFLFSGEGSTDFGVAQGDAVPCEGEYYKHGPMAVIVDQVVERNWKYSILESGQCGFISELCLDERSSALKRAHRKSLEIRGKKRRSVETTHFYKNARTLAVLAKDKELAINDKVVVVFFRDLDNTASAGHRLWQDKWDSMIAGFDREEFERGVPMIPKPKSEAWVICALKYNPYQGCAALEERSGNDHSPNSLKGELARIFGKLPSRQELCEMVADRTIDIDRIRMPKFKEFRDRLEQVLREN